MRFWSNSAKLREILLVIPKDEYSKMAKGVEHTIQSINVPVDYQWKVKIPSEDDEARWLTDCARIASVRGFSPIIGDQLPKKARR